MHTSSAILRIGYSIAYVFGFAFALSVNAQTNDAPRRVFEAVSPSTVVIEAVTQQGSGVVYNNRRAQDGTLNSSVVVTNAHVVTSAREVFVRRGSRRVRAEVEFADEEMDVAILNVRDEVWPPAQVAATAVNVGERVYAVGSPLGLESSISEGLISGVRNVKGFEFIQTTAQISKGSSGGGLFTWKGDLVGITSFKLTEGDGLGFALSIRHVLLADDAIYLAGVVRVFFMQDSQFPEIKTPHFASWLLRTRNAEGRTMFEQAKAANDDRRGDPSPKALQGIYDRFFPIVVAYFSQSGASSKRRNPELEVTLVCQLRSRTNELMELTFVVDYDTPTVQHGQGRRFPATINEQYITWKYTGDRGVESKFVINRYSGGIQILDSSYRGDCKPAQSRRF